MEIKRRKKPRVSSFVAYHLVGLQSLSCVPGSVNGMFYGLKKVTASQSCMCEMGTISKVP